MKPMSTFTDPDGVSKSQRDGKRQSFWYSDDKHSDTDDEELHKLFDVFVGPRQVTYGECRDAEPQYQDHDCSYRYCCACNISQP